MSTIWRKCGESGAGYETLFFTSSRCVDGARTYYDHDKQAWPATGRIKITHKKKLWHYQGRITLAGSGQGDRSLVPDVNGSTQEQGNALDPDADSSTPERGDKSLALNADGGPRSRGMNPNPWS
ncbi:MAG: hypothetical protein RQM92_04420 [Candidatus Syntrophopropionicum ammoniitolerans]